MLTTVKGIYENGQVFLEEMPPTKAKMDIIITFLGEVKERRKNKKQGVRLGSWEGKYTIPDNFNEPLDDLKEYI